MTLRTQIVGRSPSYSADVERRGFLQVAERFGAAPPEGTENVLRYFASLLGSTGVDSGTTNMNVNGSVTPQEFYIESHVDYDIHMTCVVIIFADTAVVHNKFGNENALGNGFDLKVTESGVDTFLIKAAKTGGEMIAQSGFGSPYGDGATSFELSNWTGTEDAQTVAIPLGVFIPQGIRIGRGTKDRITAIVNDNLTGLTEFTVRILGFRRYP